MRHMWVKSEGIFCNCLSLAYFSFIPAATPKCHCHCPIYLFIWWCLAQLDHYKIKIDIGGNSQRCFIIANIANIYININGGCDSGGRAGRPLIPGLAVWSLAPPFFEVSLNAFIRQLKVARQQEMRGEREMGNDMEHRSRSKQGTLGHGRRLKP